ncbi:MAG: glucose-1-phosphate adenylyltransferase, partial [Gammaproteobacteria bacterium]|nr:glucose-1-phosphate adenylyltransferase [Gammaproteobacteria bacterium]
FSNVRVHSYSQVNASVLLPEVEVGHHCRIRRAVIDRGCQIPPGTVIGEDPGEDARRFRVTEKGIVLVTAEMFGQETKVSLS